MSEVIPQWLVDTMPTPNYDAHTSLTAYCAHGRHDRCTSEHHVHQGHHTVIVGRDGFPVQHKGGPLASVHLTADECAGCHCTCHYTNVQLDLLAAV
jgi:hypothetical protein